MLIRGTLMKKLILLRGNSGSGKTTTAKAIKELLSPNAFLVSQDVLRKQMLSEPDCKENKSISLIKSNIEWGISNVDYIILEGILKKSVYRSLLMTFKRRYTHEMLIFYFNISFNETLRRNQLKDAPFSEEALLQWWQDKDLLGNEDYVFTDQEKLEQRLVIIKKHLE
ncbi:hypothetical protein FD15_GL002199 [Liquorilactobacillus sucicola DSM 21376 = JCM 15457]|uniref:UDP-N-acetylglucosamine kinase n=2 Tax=Liquorilactobacillus sucicola TaxID=519050 RepID=A0A0R2DQB9_9LACO|nr:hypothetical protein FD15_GL002199 [Liquorilactobacillus sucicola DSM 21376 = JCM 15457]